MKTSNEELSEQGKTQYLKARSSITVYCLGGTEGDWDKQSFSKDNFSAILLII